MKNMETYVAEKPSWDGRGLRGYCDLVEELAFYEQDPCVELRVSIC